MVEVSWGVGYAWVIWLVISLERCMEGYNYEVNALIETTKDVDTKRHELEATEEEIYRVKSSHHYIGALWEESLKLDRSRKRSFVNVRFDKWDKKL